MPPGGPWTSWALNVAWHRVLARAAVRYRSPGQFRHTLASQLLSRGAPLPYVLSVGGWRGANVLFAHYSKWLPTGIEEAGAETRPTHAPATSAQPHRRTLRATS